MAFTTAQLCDSYAQEKSFQIAEPLLKPFGANTVFSGQITTLKVFEDQALIADTLAEKVEQRVLVVDGGGSHRVALLDYELANLAVANGWQGLVIYGCIRDSARINQLPISILALHTHPLKGHQKSLGDRDLLITFAGINFKKDHFLYADADGIIVSATQLR